MKQNRSGQIGLGLVFFSNQFLGMKLFTIILLIHQATAFFWWPFQGINTKSRKSTYGLGYEFHLTLSLRSILTSAQQ